VGRGICVEGAVGGEVEGERGEEEEGKRKWEKRGGEGGG